MPPDRESFWISGFEFSFMRLSVRPLLTLSELAHYFVSNLLRKFLIRPKLGEMGKFLGSEQRL